MDGDSIVPAQMVSLAIVPVHGLPRRSGTTATITAHVDDWAIAAMPGEMGNILDELREVMLSKVTGWLLAQGSQPNDFVSFLGKERRRTSDGSSGLTLAKSVGGSDHGRAPSSRRWRAVE